MYAYLWTFSNLYKIKCKSDQYPAAFMMLLSQSMYTGSIAAS